VRISRGRFDPAAADRIAALLAAPGADLVPAIRRLPGLVRYYGGIDREHGVIVNVSVWESEAHALQMAALPEMLAQSALRTGRGRVRTDPQLRGRLEHRPLIAALASRRGSRVAGGSARPNSTPTRRTTL